MYSSIVLGALWTAGLATAETIVIEAGNVYFKPQTVNASVGDVLEFHFLPNNHSVVMGGMLEPCQPATLGGFYSGFLPVSSGENAQVFQVTINNTDPIVYYCSQNASNHNHCKSGMYGFVNQHNQTLIDNYGTSASKLDINISPDGSYFGGILAANTNSTASNSTSSDNSTTSGTSTATGTGAEGSGTAKETATKSSASASGTATDSSGADAMSVGSVGGALALLLALVAA